MKKILISFYLIAFFIAVGCKKEEVKTTSTTQDSVNSVLLNIPKIKRTRWVDQTIDASGKIIKSDSSSTWILFEYDQNGRITKLGKSRYNYSTKGKVTVTEEGSNKVQVYTLNNEGLATNYERLNYDPHTMSYIYNTDGFLLGDDDDVDSTISTHVLNGNLVKVGDYFNEFYLDKINTIGYYNQGMTFWGKQNKNLPSKSYNSAKTSGMLFNYEFDAKNRVVKEIKYSENSIYREIILYEYYD